MHFIQDALCKVHSLIITDPACNISYELLGTNTNNVLNRSIFMEILFIVIKKH